MSNDGKIKIGTELDLKSFEEVKKKIKEMREMSSGGSFAQNIKQVNDERQRAQLEKFRQREEAKHKEFLSKEMEKSKKTLSDQLKIYNDIDQKLKNINNTEEENTKLKNEQAKAAEKITQEMDKQSKINSQLGGGGGGGGGGILNNIKSMGLSQILSAIGAVGSAAVMASRVYQSHITMPNRRASAEASLAQMTGELGDLQSRRKGYEYFLYEKERKAAFGRAEKTMEAEKLEDKADILDNVMKKAAVGALTGAALTAKANVVPKVGQAIFGTATAIGGLAGGAYGFFESMQDDRKRSMLFDPESYDKFIGAEGAEEFKKQLALEKIKSFDKTRAADYLSQNKDNFLSAQRQFGMTDKQLFKGKNSLLDFAASQGFTEETTLGKMREIYAGGGSAAASKQGAVIAAELERDYKLTNAGALLGKISGGTGANIVQSEEQIIRLYAKATQIGTRLGLNESDFIKEIQTFSDKVTDIAYQTGVNTNTLSHIMEAGVAQGSERGVQGAVTAFEALKGQTSQTGGLTGQIQLARLQSKEMKDMLGGKSFDLGQLSVISGMSGDEINSQSKYMQYIFEEFGIKDPADQEKIIKSLREIKVSGTNRFDPKGLTEKYKKLQHALEKGGSEKDVSTLMGEIRGVEDAQGSLGGFKSEGEITSYILQKAKLGYGTKLEDMTTPVERKPKSEGMFDLREGSEAKDAAQNLANLTKYSGELEEAFKKNITNSLALAEAFALAKEIMGEKGLTKETAAEIKALLTSLGQEQSEGSKKGSKSGYQTMFGPAKN